MVQSIWLRLLFGSAIALSAADPAVSQAAPPTATKAAASDEFAARGQREARSIKYGDWQKLCFKPGGAKMVCRTTISGTFATGQTAVRVYVTEREGDSVARLQLFLPVGLYMPPGVKLSVDKGMLGLQEGDDSPVEVYLSVVLEETATEIRRAIASGLIDVDQTHEDVIKPRRLVIGRQWFRFTDDELAEFARRYDELFESFAANALFGSPGREQSTEGTLYEYLGGFFPAVPPEEGDSDG